MREPSSGKLLAKVAGLRLGRGTDASVTVGPLIDDKAVAKMQDEQGVRMRMAANMLAVRRVAQAETLRGVYD